MVHAVLPQHPPPSFTHDADAEMHNNNHDNDTSAPPSKKRKTKSKDTKKPHILYQATFRKPIYSYFHLVLITPGLTSTTPNTSPQHTSDIDPLLASQLLSKPLQAYLGITGAAIPIDILKTSGRGVWIRVARQDARGLRAALSGWIGACAGENVPGVREGGKMRVSWRVVGEAGTLGGVDAWNDGVELFGE